MDGLTVGSSVDSVGSVEGDAVGKSVDAVG